MVHGAGGARRRWIFCVTEPPAQDAEYPLDRRKFVFFAAILALLTVACIALVVLLSGTPRIVGGIFAVVYGAGFIGTVRYMANPRVIVRTAGTGLQVGQGPEIPWASVTRAEVRGKRPGRRLLAVSIADPDAYIARLPGAKRARAQRMNSRHGTPILIPERFLGRRFEDAAADVTRQLRRER